MCGSGRYKLSMSETQSHTGAGVSVFSVGHPLLSYTHERTTLPTPSTVAIIAAAAPIWDRGGRRPPWIREPATTPPAPSMPPMAADCNIRWTLQPMCDLRVQRAEARL